jgi:hypothetical protein
MDNSESISIVLCHPEILAIMAAEARRDKIAVRDNPLANMRLVCRAFRVAVNHHITRLSISPLDRMAPLAQVSVGVWLT